MKTIPCPPQKLSVLLVTLVMLFAASDAQAQVETIVEEGDLVELVDEVPAWTGSFAAGFNGKTGNSQNLDVNFAVNVYSRIRFRHVEFYRQLLLRFERCYDDDRSLV